MRTERKRYLTVAALALLAAACRDPAPEQPQLPPTPQGAAADVSPPADATPESEAAALEALPPECDLSGEDMSQMTAERHEMMRAACEGAKARQENPQPAP